MISGYATARLYAPILASNVDVTSNLLGVSAVVSNLTANTVKMSFVPLESRTTAVLAGSGTRCTLYREDGTNLGSYIYVSGGGTLKVAFSVTTPYLEIFTDGGGPGAVRIQLDSLIQWEQLAFARADSKYPASLYAPKWADFPWPT